MHYSFFSDKNLNFIGQLFYDNGNIKPWKDLKIEFHLKDTHEIYWLQIIGVLPKTLKDIILKDKGNAKNLVIFHYHIVRNFQICSLNKLTRKELYLILIVATSQFNWKKIYFLIRNTTLDTKAHMFQYKVLHNILYTNKILFKFGKLTSP